MHCILLVSKGEEKLMKKITTYCLSLLMAFVSFGIQNLNTVQAATPTDSYQYIGKVENIEKSANNKIDITTDNKEKIRLTFLSNNIFRLNMELSTGDFLDDPVPNDSQHTTKMLEKYENEYDGPTNLVINETDTEHVIATPDIELRITKENSLMKLINKKTGDIVWEEKEPLQYKKNRTVQTLKTDENENFFGGGMQNGYFSHKGTTINIVKNPNKWGDGYAASPTPLYISTNGYGVMRHTWKPGTYDFGDTTKDAVKALHEENRFDAFYFVEPDNTIPKVISDFVEMTGNPYLMPEYAWYLGHLNCYSRDTWKKTNTGTPLYEINGENWLETSTGDVLEKLNGSEGPTAQNILNMYLNNDMPVGLMLPNDGYGCGYGRTGSIEGNIENLGQFSGYANSKGVETGLWTQSYLTPQESANERPDLQRDLANETAKGGVRALKTDVAWVGPGYSMALHAVATASKMIENNSNYRSHIISLDGWNGTQRYASLWSGDQTGGNWEYIRFHIPTYIGSGLSGQPNVGSDQNGIWGADPLISTRDYQWKAFTPIQLDMDGWASEVKMPSYYKQNAEINRFYLKLKAEMLPYNYSNGWEATNTGMPMLRAMVLEYPDDPYTYGKGTQYQYMWGKNLLVAPVYQNVAADAQGNDIRNGIYLPDENQVWIDYFSGKQYTGGSIVNGYEVPVWKQPVFVKNGAIIPMTPENNTPQQIAKDATRIFDVYPSGETDFTMYEDDGVSTEYKNGAHATTKITSKAPVTGEGTATITVDTPKGDYAATKKANKRATEFIVNVQKEPTSLSLKVGDNNVQLTKVNSMEEFEEATTAVMYYAENPNLNKYSHLGAGFAEFGEVITTPKVYVKTAKDVDITSNKIELVVNGFDNTAEKEDDGATNIPSKPENIHAIDERTDDKQITFAWDESAEASSYDVKIDGSTPIITGILNAEYVLKDLEQDSEHTIQVRARNSIGVSEWSDVFGYKTKLDRYRNVPKNMGIRFDGQTEPAIYTGVLSNIIDNNNATEYSSKDGGAWLGKAFEIDMKSVYHIEKIEYLFRSDARNGAVSKFELKYSIDGIDWETMEWNIDINGAPITTPDVGNPYKEAILEFDTPIDAKYLNFTVKDSYGGFLQAYEIRPYMVDGTKGYLPGDWNENGEIDEGDLEFLKNYSGRTVGDADWDYAGKADMNKNGVIDAYDVVFVSSQLGKPLVRTGETSSGVISIVPNKRSAQAGEEILYTVYGTEFNDVNAFYLQTIFDSNYSFVGESIQPTRTDIEMINFSKLAEGSNRVNIIFANKGEQPKIKGNNKLATFKLKANNDIADTTLTIDKAFIVGSDMKEKNANTADNVEEIVTDAGASVLHEADIKNITFDNSVKKGMDGSTLWQQANWKTLLFDGNKGGTLAEFKYVSNGSLADEVILPIDMNFAFKEKQGIQKVIVYNRVSGTNGRITSIKATAYDGDTAYELGSFDAYQEEYEFTAPEGMRKVDKVVITPLTSYGTTAVTSGPTANRMLSIREIEFISNNYVPTEKIKFKESDVEINVGVLKPLDIVYEPADASKSGLDVVSSDPSVAEVQKLVASNGKASYAVWGLKAGTAEITLTSSTNPTITSKMTVTVKNEKSIKDLDDLLKEVEKLPMDLYTEDSYKTLTIRIEEAKAILTDPNLIQEDIDKAEINIIKAKMNLEIRDTRPAEKIPVKVGEVTVIEANAEFYSDRNYPQHVIDGDSSTFWETPYSGTNAKLPKDIVLTLADVADVDQLDFTPNARFNGAITEFKVYTSVDGVTWDDAAHVEISPKTYTVNRDYSTVEVKFGSRKAKYIKFEALAALESSGAEGANYADVQELSVYGRIAAKGIVASAKKEELLIDETTTIAATLEPVYTTVKKATFTSSDDSVASVDANGKVTAHAKGTAIITVTSEATPTVSTTIEIKVNPIRDLTKAIERASEYTDASLYTTSSWATFTTALDEAIALRDAYTSTTKALITQEMINTATTNLVQAIDGLIELTTKDKLETKIAEIEEAMSSLTKADFTKGSWESLEAAIATAKVAVTEEEIANAMSDITAKFDNLVNISELKTALADVTTPDAKYSKASIKAHNNAISQAQAILDNPNATADEVAQAITKVTGAKTLLVDVSDLVAEITKAQKQYDDNVSKYTSAYAKKLQEAIASATKAKDNVLTKTDLTNAIAALKEVSGKAVYLGDKIDLSEVVNGSNVENVIKNKNDYTQGSYAKFELALENAKTVLANPDATQQEIDDALKLLQKYLSELVKAPAIEGPDKVTPTPESPKNGSNIKTVDATNVSLLVMMTSISLLALILTYRRKKLKK